jgi:hypothetical protein
LSASWRIEFGNSFSKVRIFEEVRSQKTEDRSQKTEDRRQKSEVRRQKTEVRRQKQKTEVGKAEVGGGMLTTGSILDQGFPLFFLMLDFCYTFGRASL